jgi:glutaredoxin
MSNSIIIFTLNGCQHCDSLKERFTNLSIPYNELDIEKNEELWNKIVDYNNSEVVPTILMYDEYDKGEIFIPGKDYETEDEIVKIIEFKIKGT